MAACTGMLTCRRLALAPAAALGPIRCSAARPALLQTQFLRPACSLTSMCSAFGGLRLSTRPSLESFQPSRRGMRIVTTAGNCMGNTKGGTRRARTRTSGYRARRLTPGGRHVLRNRRKKGRKILTPASNYKK